MEQPVYFFFGILSFLIALGIIVSLVSENEKENKLMNFDASLSKLQSQCNFVCQTNEGNNLGTNIKLPSKSKLYTNNNKICISLENELACKPCNCNLETYELNLNTSLSESFNELDYRCYFEKLKETVNINCKG